MKKAICGLIVIFTLLGSLLLFSQCTSEKAKAEKEILREIEKNYMLTDEWADKKIYVRYIGNFEVEGDQYTVSKNSGQIEGSQNPAPEKIREMEQFMEDHPEIWNKIPRFPETIENQKGETCTFHQFTTAVQKIKQTENGLVPFCTGYGVYRSKTGYYYALTVILNLRDGTETCAEVFDYQSNCDQWPFPIPDSAEPQH